MPDYVVRALEPKTWDAFARLAERHNGVFGGCWCTYFHTMHDEKTSGADDNRALKKRLVEEAAHTRHSRPPTRCPTTGSRASSRTRKPGVRVRQRSRFVAVDLIQKAGGGVAEGYPNDTEDGRKVSVLYSATRAVYERVGFSYVRPKRMPNSSCGGLCRDGWNPGAPRRLDTGAPTHWSRNGMSEWG